MDSLPNDIPGQVTVGGAAEALSSNLVKPGAYERGQEFLGQCPELLAAEVSAALNQLRSLDTFVAGWAKQREGTLDSADIARLARTVIASARARGEVAASLLKALPTEPRRRHTGPRQEA